ncbi:MAG TPA: site-specific integrase [Sulfuriferula sp.]|nr:site-specific integrase [Sulfuriferula sp.]
MSVFEIGKDRYRVQVRRKGFPAYDQVFATRQLAEAAQARVMGEQKLVLKPGDITLNEAWERYRDSVDFSRKSASTQKTELTRIKPVLAVLAEYSLLALQDAPRLIYDYIDRRSKVVSQKTRQTISSSSLRLEIAALSAVAMWAQRRKYIIKNFVRDVARPGLAKRKRRVPPVELGKLELTAMNFDEPKLAEAARFLLLLRFLGCRPGELARLLNADIRFSKLDVTLKDTKFRHEDRLVHVTPNATKWLHAQFEHAMESAPDSPYLFSTRSRKKDDDGNDVWVPYHYSNGIKMLRGEGVLAVDFHAHAMRREYISRAIESGLPYSTIRKQTGHHSTQAIEIYDEGLSTAPEIRDALDQHEKSLSLEQFGGLLEAYGFSKEAAQKILASHNVEKKSPITRGYANAESVSIGKQKKR